MKSSTLIFIVFKKVILGILLFPLGLVSAAEIQVPADHATIQAAVDAATDGDTIHIAPGVYVEQVYISNKNLTLVGRPGTVLRAFPGMDPAGTSPIRAVVFVYGSELVTLRGLTIEGEQLASPPPSQFVGVFYRRSGATIENCRFTGFREKTPGTGSAAAIRVDTFNYTGGEFAVTIRDNVIVDSYSGMGVRAQGTPTTFNILIENNVIQGVGPNSMGGAWGMRGIDLGDGVTGLVARNVISEFSYVEGGPTPRFPLAWGILAVDGDVGAYFPLEPIHFENNTLRNNNLHMVLVRANDSEVVNNRFEGTAPSQDMAGLWFSGENLRVEGNEFREMELGVRAGKGSVDIGFAFNATMTDNRFCEVVTPVEIARGSSVTETGTSNCDSPESELLLTHMVRLTWPGYYDDDYVLEGAPSTDGLWSPIETTLAIEDGSLTAYVPAEDSNQFFRLHAPQ